MTSYFASEKFTVLYMNNEVILDEHLKRVYINTLHAKKVHTNYFGINITGRDCNL